MKKYITLIILAMTFSLITFNAIANQRPRSIKNLSPDQSLEIDYLSRGCFHRHHVSISILPGKPFTVKIKKCFFANKQCDVEQVLELSAEDIEKLDQQINYYREKHTGNCTTIDTLTLNWNSKGVNESTELFSDESCTQNTLQTIISKILKSRNPA